MRSRPTRVVGGWTWYTGSAGWMYRLIVESLLGVRREAQRLTFAPRLPAAWPSCEIQYRYGETLYRISIRQALAADTAMSVRVDGVAQSERSVLLVDDHRDHVVEVAVRAAPAAASEYSENGRPVVPRQRGANEVISSTDS